MRREKAKEIEELENKQMGTSVNKAKKKKNCEKESDSFFTQNLIWQDEREKKKMNAKLRMHDIALHACNFTPEQNTKFNEKVKKASFYERQENYQKKKEEKGQIFSKKFEKYDFKPKLCQKSLRMADEKSARSHFNKTNQNSPRFNDPNDSFINESSNNNNRFNNQRCKTPNERNKTPNERCKTPNERYSKRRTHNVDAINRLNQPFRNKANNIYQVADLPDHSPTKTSFMNDDYIELNVYDKIKNL